MNEQKSISIPFTFTLTSRMKVKIGEVCQLHLFIKDVSDFCAELNNNSLKQYFGATHNVTAGDMTRF